MPPSKVSRFPVSDPLEQAALRHLARRDRTVAQMKAYLLTRMGASPTRAMTLIKRLQARGYLKDRAYALRWARSRIERRPMGRERLEAELRGQGLDRNTVAEVLEQVYSEVDERDLARLLMGRTSVSAGLLRRYGFNEDLIGELFGEESGQPSAFSNRYKNKLTADR